MTGSRIRTTGRLAALIALAALLVLLLPGGAALAHPLGNFTTNAYAGILVTPDEVRVDYVLDLAEVPAFQTLREEGLDGSVHGRQAERFQDERCADLAGNLTLDADGRELALGVVASTLELPDGEAGLPTLRLECTLAAARPTPGEDLALDFSDGNAQGRVGWREITATGEGMRIDRADVDARSASDRLRAYPEEQLTSPVDQRRANILASPDGTAGPPPIAGGAAEADGGIVARGIASVDRWFTGLVAVQDLTVAFGLFAVLAALGLGALHSLAPGHGKTVMAAYVVGREGSNRQALALAVTVAATHTLGVLILGITLSVTQTFAPEQLYPYLGTASGLLFALIGGMLLRRALRSRTHGHTHGNDHPHGHDRAPAGRALTWRSLIAPGLAGGLVPSPSALLVLLGGIALGRAWFGVGLVVAYGIGMAGALVGAGYVLLRLRHRLEGRASGRRWAPAARLTRQLPVLTSVVILVVGVGLTATSVLQI